MAQLNAAGGAASVVHPGDPYVLGHEFTAEIVDYGPETGGTLRVGSVVCVNTQGDRFVPALTADTQGYGRRRSR